MVNQGFSMSPNLLILAGTIEATRLAQIVADRGIRATLSYAGRVERTKPQPIPKRIGGFGGPQGLAAYIKEHGITHVIDATHPFAAQMSTNAVEACQMTQTPLVALPRTPWRPQAGDCWTHVSDIPEAAMHLQNMPASRIMLAVGRMHLDDFAIAPQHFYLLRLVDPVDGPLPLPNAHAIISRGPFTIEDDRALMQKHSISWVVSKNAGGTGAMSKITAARDLGLPVIMIDRPHIPKRQELHDPADILPWVHQSSIS
jgi:precorrin-6A/cobalt-precorrin-6A reductase